MQLLHKGTIVLLHMFMIMDTRYTSRLSSQISIQQVLIT